MLSSIVCDTGKAWLPGRTPKVLSEGSRFDQAERRAAQRYSLRISANCGSWFGRICGEKLSFRCLALWCLALVSRGARCVVMGRRWFVPTAVQNQLLPEHNYLLTPKHSLPQLCTCQPSPEKCILNAFLFPDRQMSISVVDLPVFRKSTTSQNYRASLEIFSLPTITSLAGKLFCIPMASLLISNAYSQILPSQVCLQKRNRNS